MKNKHTRYFLLAVLILFLGTNPAISQAYLDFEWVEIELDPNDSERLNLHGKVTNIGSTDSGNSSIAFQVNYIPNARTHWNLYQERTPILGPGESVEIKHTIVLTGIDAKTLYFKGGVNASSSLGDSDVATFDFAGTQEVMVDFSILTKGEGQKIRQRPDGGFDLLIFEDPVWKIMVLDIDCQIRYEKILGEGYAEFDKPSGFLLATKVDTGAVVKVEKFDRRGMLYQELFFPINEGKIKTHPNIVPHNYGGFYLISSFGYNGLPVIIPDQLNSYIWLAKIDSNDIIEKEEIWGSGEEYETSQKTIIATSGDLYISAGLNNHYRARFGSRILRFDSELNFKETVEQKIHHLAGHELRRVLKPDPNGGIISGIHEAIYGGRYGPNRTISLTRDSTYIRTNNGFSWYDFEDNMHLSNLAPTSDGGIVVLGGWQDTLYYKTIHMIKLDAFGKVEWMRTTPSGGRDILQTPDGNYMITGVQDSMAYITVMDAFGRYDEALNCDEYTMLTDNDMDGFLSDEDCDDENPDVNPDATEIPNNGIDDDCDGFEEISSATEIYKHAIKVYPNPFKHSTRFELLNEQIGTKIFKLTNISGQQVHLQKFESSNYVFERGDLKAGIYFYKISNEESILAIGKIIIR